MLIVCPNCATSYAVAPASLGEAGRSVRCVRCKQTWFATNAESNAAIVPSPEDMAVVASDAPAPEPAPVPAPVPRAATEGFAVLEEVPPPPAPEPAVDAPRDDRGPAPLPERMDDPPAAPAVADAPPTAPDEPPAPGPTDIESAALRMQRKAARRRSAAARRRWAAAILVLIAVNAGLVFWRNEIVRLLPQTASLYAAVGLPVNLRGVAFGEIVTRTEEQDGVQMLVIEGTIKSTSRRTAEVPRLRFAVRNARGQEIHSWTAMPERNVLAPGEALPFRTRLAAPPPEAHAVLVRFFNRRDLIAGSH